MQTKMQKVEKLFVFFITKLGLLQPQDQNVIKRTYLVSRKTISISNVVGFISFDQNNHDTMYEELTGLIDNLHICAYKD